MSDLVCQNVLQSVSQSVTPSHVLHRKKNKVRKVQQVEGQCKAELKFYVQNEEVIVFAVTYCNFTERPTKDMGPLEFETLATIVPLRPV